VVWEDTLKRILAATVALLVTACGNPDAYLSDTSASTGFVGSKDPSKTVDEPLTVESDLSSSESALTISNNHVAVCTDGSTWARCYARARINGAGEIHAASTPQGFGPADIQAAYKLPSTGGAGLTIGIVDSNDDPTAEADLAVYRAQYGLPPCTTANGCFKKVNQRGAASPLPTADTGWAGEISLDLDMVSAACPTCKILLVEVDSASMDNLGAGVNTAVSLGAVAVSNSYGGSEDSTVVAADSSYFNHPGVLITASTGDSGYGASYPATSAHVTAAGGTALTKSSSAARGWTETAWTSGGSGCSAYIAKPSFQKDTGCKFRMEGDVAAVADPNTGVAVYVTYGNSGGWNVYGGTSASSPLIAAIFAVTGNASQDNAFSYSNTAKFYDVTSGSNGTCTTPYECKAAAGYDGPTGNGTPNGALLTGSTGGGSGGGTGGGSGGGTGGGSTGGGSGGGTGGGSTGGGSGGGTGGGSTGGGSGGGTGSTEKEPNNSRATANLVTSGVAMSGAISSSSDVDYFKIVASPGTTAVLTLTHLTADCDLRLYSSSGSLLGLSDVRGTGDESITGTLTNSIYYAKISGYSGAKCSYVLNVTLK
jgi:hypothetical protein